MSAYDVRAFRVATIQCAICNCPASGASFGFAVCDYHQLHGEDSPPCPACGVPAPERR